MVTGTLPSAADLGTSEGLANFTLDVTSFGGHFVLQTLQDFNTRITLERWNFNNSWENWKIIYTEYMLTNTKQMGILASALGVKREVKNARVAWDTDISVNTGDSNTHAYLYLASNHGDAGDNTNYEFGVIRLGYDGDHATKTKISGVDVISVSVVNSKLVLTPVGSTPTFMTLIQ